MAFFPLCSLAITRGLGFLVHPTTFISIKALPLFSQPFSALTPRCKGAQHGWHVVTIDKGLQDPSPNGNKHPPCTVSAEQHPEPCTRAARTSMGSGRGHREAAGRMARVFLPSQTKSTATLQFHNRRLKTH